jgi:hypothetical protein
MDLPVAQFFMMLRESSAVIGSNYSHLCDIQMLSNCEYAYYQKLQMRYRTMMGFITEPHEPLVAEARPTISGRRVYDSGSTEAKYAVMEMFKNLRVH